MATGTRERLLRAAQELVEEGGYAAASVAAIAQRAGVAAGALYRYWPSKGALFAELFRSVCDREVAAMEAVEGRGVARVEEVLATFALRALRNPRLAWALIAEPVDPLVDVERLAYRREYARRLEDGLRDAIAAGELPPQDVELTAATLVGGVGEALVGPVSPLAGGGREPDAIVAALKTFTRRAVGAPTAGR
jgi:AcrR family transcriptional regulator